MTHERLLEQADFDASSFVFFFSSRRRHTRCGRDWSSDVCSSDLSPIYTSTNPGVTGGAIKLVGTVSDIFSNGSPGSPAHRLMPGFLWTGNQTIDGKTVELYRMYIFTDKQCLNRVYTSAVIGSPAYAPRPFGPLQLPTSAAGEVSARSGYLHDGA